MPLLFLMFAERYGIPLTKITFLVTVNFVIQLLIDLLAIGFVDKVGYRVSMVAAHLFAAAGLAALTVLPDACSDPFTGLLISVVIYAMGGGLLEVLVSPVVEACPTKNKEKMMSLLHSFYCWGQVGVVLLSTAFFCIFGIAGWKYLALLWAVLPLANAAVFTRVPIAPLVPEDENGLTVRELASRKIFWILILMMICAGASEQAVSQWASAFAEKGLGVSKAVGDLAGPMSFAFLMGTARAFYGKFGEKIKLERFLTFSGILCIASYLCISLFPSAVLGLAGCAVCGLSVGILWPATFSIGSASIRGGGTAMFALMALAGDLGCSGGPTLVGMVSGQFGDNLRAGILAAVIFPALLLAGVALLPKRKRA